MILNPIIVRWMYLFSVAKALRTWLEFVQHSQGFKKLFHTCFSSNNHLILSNSWEAWEEILTEAKSKQIMKKIIEMLHGTILKDFYDGWLTVAVGGSGNKFCSSSIFID